MLEDDPDKHTTIQIRVKQIASYDKAGKVTEPVLSGYYQIGADKPVKIAQQATIFDVIYDTTTAKWHIADGGPVVNGKLTGLPTMTFDNHIPIYYTYEVEELPLEGYKASYDSQKNINGGTSVTVTNKPNTNNPTTKVQAKKRWVDVNGNDVTNNMGLDDDVAVNVYRYEGALTRGTIVEADGTLRDPTEMFTIVPSFSDDSIVQSIDNPYIYCLPGDVIHIKVKPLKTRGNMSFDQLSSNSLIVWLGSNFKPTITKDAATGCFITEATPSKDMTRCYFEFVGGEIEAAEISIENISSEGRTQILTQADLDAIPAEDKVWKETLVLNKQNGWSATSKEYVKKATITETVTEPWGWTHDVTRDVVYTYFIVEPDGLNFEADYSVEGDVTTVTNIDKKLEVDKTWFAANGKDDITETKENGTVTYTVKRNKYRTPVPETATITTNGLTTTYNGNINLVLPSEPIKVGSTVKMTFKLAQNQATIEDSPMNGLTISGIDSDSLIDSGPKKYIPFYEQQDNYNVVREYQFVITENNVNLSGEIEMCLTAAQNSLNISFDILKQPSGTYIPDEDDTPVETEETVGTVTVGYDSVVSANFTDSNVVAENGSTPWSVVINKLPGTDGEFTYTYYVEETVGTSDDFELVSITPSQGTPVGGKVQVVNKLKPGSLKVKKVVEGAVPPGKTYQIAVTDADGNYYDHEGKNYGSTPYYETFSAGDELIWNPLTPGNYQISEKDASENNYSWTVTGTDSVKVELGKETAATVTNSYYETTKYIPQATKALKIGNEDVDPWPAGVSFDFYLTFVSAVASDDVTPLSRTDITMSSREAVATESQKTGQFGEIEFKMPGTYTFTIEEVEPAGTQNHKRNGIEYSEEKVTLTVVIGEKEGVGNKGKLEVKSATYSTPNSDSMGALITNKMSYPDYSPSVTKSLKENGVEVADVDWGNRTFTFDLAIDTNDGDTAAAAAAGNILMPSGEAAEATVDKDTPDHKKAFGKIHFKAAGTYKFLITERDLSSSDSQVSYDTTAKPVEVTVEDVGDGNLAVTKVKVDGTEVTGDAIVGSGVTVTNTYTREKEYKFKKVWLDDNSASANSVQWVKDIKVDLYGRKNGAQDTHLREYTIQYPAPAGAAYTVELKEEVFGGNHYNSYEVTIPHLDAQYDSFYVVEQPVDGYATDYGKLSVDDPTETTNSIDIVAEKTSADDGEYVINSLIHVTLPSTGGFGTTPFCYMGIVLIALASVLFAYINRSKLSMICMENSVGSGRKTNKRRGGGGL